MIGISTTNFDSNLISTYVRARSRSCMLNYVLPLGLNSGNRSNARGIFAPCMRSFQKAPVDKTRLNMHRERSIFKAGEGLLQTYEWNLISRGKKRLIWCQGMPWKTKSIWFKIFGGCSTNHAWMNGSAPVVVSLLLLETEQKSRDQSKVRNIVQRRTPIVGLGEHT